MAAQADYFGGPSKNEAAVTAEAGGDRQALGSEGRTGSLGDDTVGWIF